MCSLLHPRADMSPPLPPPPCLASAIILSRPFDLPHWLVPVIRMVLPLVDGPPHVSKIAVAVLDSFWRSHRESSWASF